MEVNPTTLLLNSLLSLIPAQYLAWVPVVIAVAAILAAVLPQPAPDSPWVPLRKVLDMFALNVGNAKNLPKPTAGGVPPAALLAFVVLGLSLAACKTADLKNEAQRLAYINQIACSAGAMAQPVIVNLGSTIAVAADPADAGAVAAAVAIDQKVHDALQAACPAGTKFLQAFAQS